ncbi:MAG: DUF4132 domain-containing protein [Verrucomicrobia bacterium]|nr:DUF4132 domain-containing protein [Verrucomicrobiota bacterium]
MAIFSKNKKAAGPSQDVALPKEQHEFLKKYFGALNEVCPKLGGETFRFVVAGEGEEVLAKLAAYPKTAEALMVRLVVLKKQNPMHNLLLDAEPKVHAPFFIKYLREIPPVVLYRMARVYAAVWDARQGNWDWKTLSPEERWVEAFFHELISVWEQNLGRAKGFYLDAARFEEVLAVAGTPPATLVRLLLLEKRSYRHADHLATLVLRGLGPFFGRHPAEVAEALELLPKADREDALVFLNQWKVVLKEESLETICAWAVDPGKRVREAAETLLFIQEEKIRRMAIKRIIRLLDGDKVNERFFAIPLLVKMAEEDCVGIFEERLALETNPKVKESLQNHLQLLGFVHGEEGRGGYEDGLENLVPPVKSFPARYSFPKDLEEAFVDAVHRAGLEYVQAHVRNWDQMNHAWHRGPREIPPPISDGDARVIFRCLGDREALMAWKGNQNRYGGVELILSRVASQLSLPAKLGLVPILRLGWIAGSISPPQGALLRATLSAPTVNWVQDVLASERQHLTLLDLAAAMEAAGIGHEPLQSLFLDSYNYSGLNPLEMEPDEIWPYFYQHPDLLMVCLGLRPSRKETSSYQMADYRKQAFEILATFPRPPSAFVPFLWETALNGAKSERPKAQACLANFPDKLPLILQALGDGRKETRAVAAAWLGEAGDPSAIKPLLKALKSEKADVCRAAMMEALERLGEDLDKFLNRKQLAAEAEKKLAKGLPANLDWFPFEALPAVHWEKCKQLIPKEVLIWLLVQAVQLKSCEPGPLLRRYADLMEPAERQAFAQVVLEAWLHYDTLPKHTFEEADTLAKQDAAQFKRYAIQNPEYYPDFDEEAERKKALGAYLKQCKGSATPFKGMLAVAAAMGGVKLVPPAERYIRTWFGHRMAQCKSLLQMLAWVEHPQAIQVILSIAARFRTKGIQKEAAKLADALAERRGWTREEMEDRTVPTAGFDSDGCQVLDYGARQFTARLQEDFSLVLFNPEGKSIKNLPESNKSEDPEEVKAVKKEFSDNRKELKAVVKHQKQRLYEAMCTERVWSAEEWREYLLGHPLVGRFCQRLVWLYRRTDGTEQTFRALPDLSLTDVEDNPLALDAGGQVRIAHPVFLNEELLAAWREHLRDYEVPSLFPQFDGEPLPPGTGEGDATALEDFKGHLVNTYKLRSRCGKRGYNRGEAMDAGWFCTYQKAFPGLGLQAVVEFTGSPVLEEDRMVALTSLFFSKVNADGSGDAAYNLRPLRLAKVPRVLLSECWNDLRLMAEDGPGFDPDWEKNTQY